MLIVSELGEAMEAHRKGHKAAHLDYESDITREYKEAFEEHIKDSFEDEIADAIIRLLDMCGGLGIDIGWHIKEKLRYNKTREMFHGKRY